MNCIVVNCIVVNCIVVNCIVNCIVLNCIVVNCIVANYSYFVSPLLYRRNNQNNFWVISFSFKIFVFLVLFVGVVSCDITVIIFRSFLLLFSITYTFRYYYYYYYYYYHHLHHHHHRLLYAGYLYLYS